MLVKMYMAYNSGFSRSERTNICNDYSQISAWAKAAVRSLYADDIVCGDQNGCFNPNNQISKAELATILYSLKNKNYFHNTPRIVQLTQNLCWAASVLMLTKFKQPNNKTQYELANHFVSYDISNNTNPDVPASAAKTAAAANYAYGASNAYVNTSNLNWQTITDYIFNKKPFIALRARYTPNPVAPDTFLVDAGHAIVVCGFRSIGRNVIYIDPADGIMKRIKYSKLLESTYKYNNLTWNYNWLESVIDNT